MLVAANVMAVDPAVDENDAPQVAGVLEGNVRSKAIVGTGAVMDFETVDVVLM